MSYIKSEDNVLKTQLKQLKKSCAGYVSYLTRIVSNANELIGDLSNKEQLEILLPKFKETVNKIYIVNKDYCLLLLEENVDDEIKFFETQEFRFIQIQT